MLTVHLFPLTHCDVLLGEEDEVQKLLLLQVLPPGDQFPLIVQGLHHIDLGTSLRGEWGEYGTVYPDDEGMA